MQFCDLVEEGIKEVKTNVEVLKLPLADGGDGTIEVVNYYLKGRTIQVEVNNPFFKPIKASYLFADSSKTAFIEMAEASGVKLLDKSEFDVKNTTTFGTGELILDVIAKGAKNIILGIGGSEAGGPRRFQGPEHRTYCGGVGGEPAPGGHHPVTPGTREGDGILARRLDLDAVDVRDRVDRVRHLLPDDLERIRIRRFQSSDIPVVRFDLSATWPDEQL